MAINVSKTEFFNTGSISFSEIRDAFGGTTNNVKFSNYKRNTDIAAENPFVPDATENANISANNDLKVEDFRGSIKEYNLIQTGDEENVDLGTTDFDTTYWNGNLNKNIIKKFEVQGNVYSDDVTDAALDVEGDFLNLDVEVKDGAGIFGAGGNGQTSSTSAQDGGSALYIDNTRTNIPDGDNGKLGIILNANAIIAGGGGGGALGNSGNAGSIISCKSVSYTSTEASGGGGKNNCSAPGCPSGYSSISCNGSRQRKRCRGSGTRRGSAGYKCYSTWTRTCQQVNSFNKQGSGGTGGSGGKGEGFGSPATEGIAGNSGNTQSCGGKTSTGNDGNPGKNGGGFGLGVSGGGDAGSAIFGKKVGGSKGYKIVGKSINNIKGKETDED
jgi:hypothetical protein